MNESAKEQFKWKFWHIAVILNGVILFFAVGVIALFLFPPQWRVPGSVVSLLIALLLTIIFRRQYLKTKEWLDKNA
ncbi:MAG TPA: hypothetical protein VN429_04265 [Methanospirillum sp.]|jgi:hypothetical protein|uniref:hypothetical protein n=1 Tax=Methanospirillum sp. TaxID=45200 RepID=UPI002C251966|nr:hypothetical protein [Methanospirillum sp.]HWQ63609.1 hypothetical protein [Methanospirillum sp.]